LLIIRYRYVFLIILHITLYQKWKQGSLTREYWKETLPDIVSSLVSQSASIGRASGLSPRQSILEYPQNWYVRFSWTMHRAIVVTLHFVTPYYRTLCYISIDYSTPCYTLSHYSTIHHTTIFCLITTLTALMLPHSESDCILAGRVAVFVSLVLSRLKVTKMHLFASPYLSASPSTLMWQPDNRWKHFHEIVYTGVLL
jgi:hypothetical protein